MDRTKDPEMRASWILGGPFKKHKRRRRREAKAMATRKMESGVMQAQAKGCWEPSDAGQTGKDPAPEPSEGGHLDVLPSSRTARIHFCCFKPPSLRSFVEAQIEKPTRATQVVGVDGPKQDKGRQR